MPAPQHAGAATLNVASIVTHHARLTPDRPAVALGDLRFTYGQLDALSNQLANGLRAGGVARGDHVALTCPNVPYFPIAYLGILKIGAVAVPLNVLLKPGEIAYHLNDSDATVFLCFEGTPELPLARMGQAALADAPRCGQLIVMTTTPGAASPIPGARSLTELMAGQSPRHATEPTAPDDTAVILYTSGTTGQPKGAELTHANVTMNALLSSDLTRAYMDPRPDGRNVTLITLPLFHSTGQVAQMWATFWSGSSIVLLPRFEPATVLDVMRREAVNFWTGVPTMYWTLLQYVEQHGVDVAPVAEHLRLCTSGGAPMPVTVMDRFASVFGVRVLEGYGLSETSPVACFNHVARPSKPGTVGQPLLGVEVACVDDDDRPVPEGERGEVVIRGHNVMKGYYKRPDATKEAMRNGWFHTGDIGTIDGEGYLTIVDRKKDMILRGGFNVYPREIEDVMLTHPGVAQVAVVGVADERLGEEIKAFVVPKPGVSLGVDAIIAWCRERMAAYKYPRSVELRDSLPVSGTGKVLKRELRG